jgi:hypothetical protein
MPRPRGRSGGWPRDLRSRFLACRFASARGSPTPTRRPLGTSAKRLRSRGWWNAPPPSLRAPGRACARGRARPRRADSSCTERTVAARRASVGRLSGEARMKVTPYALGKHLVSTSWELLPQSFQRRRLELGPADRGPGRCWEPQDPLKEIVKIDRRMCDLARKWEDSPWRQGAGLRSTHLGHRRVVLGEPRRRRMAVGAATEASRGALGGEGREGTWSLLRSTRSDRGLASSDTSVWTTGQTPGFSIS